MNTTIPTYEPNTPLMNEKLPGIDKLPKLEENCMTPSPTMNANNMMLFDKGNIYQQYLPQTNPGFDQFHMSPPLTPALSPSSILMDSIQFKRKFSVDIGPFSYGTMQSPFEPDRRSSCSTLQQQSQQDRSSPVRGGPAVQHKHACTYPYCNWSFKRYEHLKRHMLIHTGKRPHVCHFPGCGKSFSRSDNFHAHYRTHTKTKLKKASSKKKQQQQQEEEGEQQDMMTASPTTMFEDHQSYYKQEQNTHQSFDLNSYQDMYTRSTTNFMPEESQGYHPSFHFNQEPHQFTTPNFYQNNNGVLDHEGFYSNGSPTYSMMQPPHMTTVNYSFTDNSTPTSMAATVALVAAASATSHQIKTKTNGDKPHTCPVLQCQRKFKRLEHLKRHMRIHTLERPFSCTYPDCHKTFSRSDNLSQHMKTHQKTGRKTRAKQSDNMISCNMMSWNATTTSTVGC